MEIAENSVDTYKLEFANCKEKVAQVFPKLDLSKVIISKE